MYDSYFKNLPLYQVFKNKKSFMNKTPTHLKPLNNRVHLKFINCHVHYDVRFRNPFIITTVL